MLASWKANGNWEEKSAVYGKKRARDFLGSSPYHASPRHHLVASLGVDGAIQTVMILSD